MKKIILLLFLAPFTFAQFNYEENKVPDYTLPPLWTTKQKLDKALWEREIRPRHLESFKKEMFGYYPLNQLDLSFEKTLNEQDIFNGLGLISNIEITFSSKNKSHKADLLIIRPKVVENAPIFIGLNFYGNHTIHTDKRIPLTKSELRINKKLNITSKVADDKSRGVRSHRWPIEMILKEGYALGVLYCGDLDPDYDDGFKNGIHQLIDDYEGYEPTTLSAWAAGMQAALTYCEQNDHLNQKKAIAIGHSRLGKTALYTAAVDTRFAMVVSNNSGCGGTALSRREFGETVKRINTNFPHWFTDSFLKYNDQENELPFDQHTFLSLMAPRPVYVASASKDQWADPKGELLALINTAPAYKIYGFPSVSQTQLPPPNTVLWAGRQGYHLREGKHDLTKFDWKRFIDFAKKHLEN